MVDVKNMTILLNTLSENPLTECIRIDTNAWWRPEQFADLDKSKIILMCTFHPSHVTDDEFIDRMLKYLSAGFKIGMVNYVMNEPNVAKFQERQKRFSDFGLVLHPNPLWGSNGLYGDDVLDLLRLYLPPLDFQYRTGMEQPLGR